MEAQMPFAVTVVRMPRTGVPCLQIRRALLLRSEALVARAEAADLPVAERLEAACVADLVQAVADGDPAALMEAALSWRACRIDARLRRGEEG